MSQEKTWQREGTFCQDQERGRRCAEWPNEQQRDCCLQEDHFFKGNIANSVLSFLPQDTVHELSRSDDWCSLSARPSGLGLDGTVNFSVWSRTDKLNLCSSEEHGARPLCYGPDIIIFPHIRTNQRFAANLHFYRHFSFSQTFSRARLQRL